MMNSLLIGLRSYPDLHPRISSRASHEDFTPNFTQEGSSPQIKVVGIFQSRELVESRMMDIEVCVGFV
ncbi:uncharacterized protein A4U43_C01F20970 [Asparagus officinalis]|uniref:Uncharacterized protein n=1 Tax=Asparagus officinalis TaxID=4686 RepID=A0A5P1FR73_ASPOF|nr:uncharacterized protein A4U43_C01F20970 [Asparagus officinalis]